jgi:general secretion pathway protein G
MKSRRAFTLIELVVVILILGILAGVAAPKLLGTSAAAVDNGLGQTISIIRDAIELYAAENGGAIPPCTGTGADFRAALVPYIRNEFPICPVGPAQNNNVEPRNGGSSVNGSLLPTEGWAYHVDTGEFICNFGGAVSSKPSMRYDGI